MNMGALALLRGIEAVIGKYCAFMKQLQAWEGRLC